MEFGLTDQDIEWLDKVIKNTREIKEIYKKLFLLEKSGKKDSGDYKNVFNDLSSKLSDENGLYQYEGLKTKCLDFIEYIMQKKVSNNLLDDIDSVIKQNYINDIYIRILKILFKILSDIKVKEKKNEMTDYLKFISDFSGVKVRFANGNELIEGIKEDFYNGFLSILQEFISNEEFSAYRGKLIYAKYYLSFISKDVESDMMYSSFEIPETFYTKSRLIADFDFMDPDDYEEMKDGLGHKMSVRLIMDELRMKDIDYSNENKAISSILRRCMIRSIFLLMRSDSVDNIKNKFYSMAYQSSTGTESENIILSCFDATAKDKGKPAILSMKSGLQKLFEKYF